MTNRVGTERATGPLGTDCVQQQHLEEAGHRREYCEVDW